jgi:hypothetical protein
MMQEEFSLAIDPLVFVMKRLKQLRSARHNIQISLIPTFLPTFHHLAVIFTWIVMTDCLPWKAEVYLSRFNPP